MPGTHEHILVWSAIICAIPIIAAALWGLFHMMRDRVHKVAQHKKLDLGRHRDPDRLLSYYTRQQVRFIAWRLGVLYWAIQTCTAVIIVGYVLVYKEGYMSFEESKGSVVTHTAGDVLAVNSNTRQPRYFGIDELTHPSLENGNVFIATTQTVRNQTRGYCDDPDKPCSSDSDCIMGSADSGSYGRGVCSEAGVCSVFSWCDVDDLPDKYDLKVDAVEIWTRAYIQFLLLDRTTVLTTDAADAEPSLETVFSVRDLLAMVEPIPIHFEEVSLLGALFEVGVRWDCNLPRHRGDYRPHRDVDQHVAELDNDRRCKPSLSVRRLDTLFEPDNIGYQFSFSEHADDKHRLLNEVSGLRFLFRTTGRGKQMSMTATITNVSTSMTLMSVAVVVSDLVMTRLFRNRKKYKARKYDRTPDFSEYVPRLEERREKKTKLAQIDQAEKIVQDREDQWLRKYAEPDSD